MPVAVMTAQIARDALQDCLGGSGRIRPCDHFREELAKEGLSIPDAWHVLKKGQIYDAPEHDVRTGDWKYRIEGKEPEGRNIAIVFCFKHIDHVLLITVFSLEGRPQ